MRYVQLNQPYYYNELLNDATLLKIAYPEFIQTENIGTTLSNSSIFMMRIGKGEKAILLTGGVHGRESINPVVLMAMAQYYANAYKEKEEPLVVQKKYPVNLKEFFEEYSLYMIPLVNPDGYMVSLRGFNIIHNEELRLKAKSLGIPYKEWKYNVNSVDINRNFPSKSWVKKNLFDEAGSELETKAVMKVMQEIPFEAYIDYHSRGKEIYYYRNTLSKTYNARQLEIAYKLAEVSGYSLVNPKEEIEAGDSGGNTVHFFSEQFKKPAFTIETVPELAQFPLRVTYQTQTFFEILYTPFFCV